MKITKFRDIPKYTDPGYYVTDMGLAYLYERVITEWAEGREYGSALDLNPDFQRGHVWTDEQKSRWLEHILRGGLTGRDIYLNHPGWQSSYKGDFVVVDGKQRLDAVRAFIENEVTVFGSYMNEFEDKLPPMEPTIHVHVNALKTRAEVLQWYLDLNAGGVVHSEEELNKVKRLIELENKGE